MKFVLILIGLAAVAFGGVLMTMPDGFIQFSESEVANAGWLRGLGAMVVVLPGLSSLLVALKRKATNALLAFSALSLTAATGALWYSLFADELSAANRWTVVLPAVLSTVAAVFLWLAWVSRRRSASGAPSGSQERPARGLWGQSGTAVSDEAGSGGTATEADAERTEGSAEPLGASAEVPDEVGRVDRPQPRPSETADAGDPASGKRRSRREKPEAEPEQPTMSDAELAAQFARLEGTELEPDGGEDT